MYKENDDMTLREWTRNESHLKSPAVGEPEIATQSPSPPPRPSDKSKSDHLQSDKPRVKIRQTRVAKSQLSGGGNRISRKRQLLPPGTGVVNLKWTKL